MPRKVTTVPLLMVYGLPGCPKLGRGLCPWEGGPSGESKRRMWAFKAIRGLSGYPGGS